MAPALLFVPVPEAKSGKNRLHLDLTPIDSSQADEVARLEALGARRVDIGQGQTKWVVLADPEGNEFCVLRSLAPGEFEARADGAMRLGRLLLAALLGLVLVGR